MAVMMAMAISMATDEDGCDAYVADGEEEDDDGDWKSLIGPKEILLRLRTAATVTVCRLDKSYDDDNDDDDHDDDC